MTDQIGLICWFLFQSWQAMCWVEGGVTGENSLRSPHPCACATCITHGVNRSDPDDVAATRVLYNGRNTCCTCAASSLTPIVIFIFAPTGQSSRPLKELLSEQYTGPAGLIYMHGSLYRRFFPATVGRRTSSSMTAFTTFAFPSPWLRQY